MNEQRGFVLSRSERAGHFEIVVRIDGKLHTFQLGFEATRHHAIIANRAALTWPVKETLSQIDYDDIRETGTDG